MHDPTRRERRHRRTRRTTAWAAAAALAIPGLAGAVQNGGFEDPLAPSWSSAPEGAWTTGAVCGEAVPEGSAQVRIDSMVRYAPATLESWLGLSPGTLFQLGTTGADEGSAVWQTIQASAGDEIRFTYDYLYSTLFAGDFPFVTLSDGGATVVAQPLVRGPLSSCGQPTVYHGGPQQGSITIPYDGTFVLGFGAMTVGRGASSVSLVLDDVRLLPATPPNLMIEGSGSARVLPVGDGYAIQMEAGAAATLTGGPLPSDVSVVEGDAVLVGLPEGTSDVHAVSTGDPLVLAEPIALGDATVLTTTAPDPAIWVDSDGDGQADPWDNCRDDANASQSDVDGDGFGDLCDADLNNDGVVGNPDFAAFRLAYGSQPGDAHWSPVADLNSDGAVGAPDFNRFRQLFGGLPGPSGLECAGTVPCAQHSFETVNALANGGLEGGFEVVDDGQASGELATGFWHQSVSGDPLVLASMADADGAFQRVALGAGAGPHADGVGQHVIGGLLPDTEYVFRARVRVHQGAARLAAGPLFEPYHLANATQLGAWETLQVVFTTGAGQTDATVAVQGTAPGTIFELDDVLLAPRVDELVVEGQGTLRTTRVGEGMLVEMMTGEAVTLSGQSIAPSRLTLFPGETALLGFPVRQYAVAEFDPAVPAVLGSELELYEPIVIDGDEPQPLAGQWCEGDYDCITGSSPPNPQPPGWQPRFLAGATYHFGFAGVNTCPMQATPGDGSSHNYRVLTCSCP